MVGDRPSTDGALADRARLAVRARALGGHRGGGATGRGGDPRPGAPVRRPPTSACLAPACSASRPTVTRFRWPSRTRAAAGGACPAPVTVRRRLDAELVRRGLLGSRRQAVEAIAAGRVLVGGSPAAAAGPAGRRPTSRSRSPAIRPGSSPAGARSSPPRSTGSRVDVRGPPGPRRRRVDRRVHRLPAPGGRGARRRGRRRPRVSSRGRCATTRASPCSSAPTSATSSPTTSAARSTSPSPTSRSSRCVTVAPALRPLHAARRPTSCCW